MTIDPIYLFIKRENYFSEEEYEKAIKEYEYQQYLKDYNLEN